MRPVIDFQHIFHGGDERRAGLGRNDELLFQVRFENVFFSVRPIVLSLTRSTIFSSTTLSSSRRKVHRARPFGGSEQLRAISFAAPAPSKMRGLAEAGECLRSPSVPMTMRHRPPASLDLGTGDRHRGYAQHRWPNRREECGWPWRSPQTDDGPATVGRLARAFPPA